jgi:hypothetical protein
MVERSKNPTPSSEEEVTTQVCALIATHHHPKSDRPLVPPRILHMGTEDACLAFMRTIKADAVLVAHDLPVAVAAPYTYWIVAGGAR